MNQRERIIKTSCPYDCGSRCLLKVHVSNGRITRIRTDPRPGPGLKACIRGLSQREVVYAPDRLKQPMKRVGERGDGKFEPITWEEALDTVAAELTRVKDRYGTQSIFLMDHVGSMAALHGTRNVAGRFFSLFGGCTRATGNTSLEAGIFASEITFGTTFTGNSRDNFLHSRLIILWGWNPLDTRFGPDTTYYLSKAKKAGAKFICIDPRMNPTGQALGAQWIPIKPATDSALLLAMAHVMITENLYDHHFIETHTVGFDSFTDYVMGKEDGIPKTPAWAEEITGVPKQTIEALARDYATIKPAALCAGWAPGRSAFGEQYHRAACTLSAMTGNIGIAGGNVGGGAGRMPFGYLKKTLPVPEISNPVVHVTDVFDALLKGKSGGYPGDIKFLYIIGCNILTQFLNTNKGAKALKEPEFIAVHELFLTPTARYADILFPVNHFMEKNDIGQPWTGGPYLIYMDKAVDPPPEVKSDLEIFASLAARLQIPNYNDRKEDAWLEDFIRAEKDIPDYDHFKHEGVHHFKMQRPWVAFREQI